MKMRQCALFLATLAFFHGELMSVSGLPGQSSSSSSSSFLQKNRKNDTHPPYKGEMPAAPFRPSLKQGLPTMGKPFGMPGVVGWVNGKWEGADYLGYLSSHISVAVEILKGEAVTDLPDERELEALIKKLMSEEGLTPQANALEGPPLPFLHLLLIIYPVEKDKYVVMGTCRIFEQIQVMRKNFSPAGYWQGITWESQDLKLMNKEEIPKELPEMVSKLATGFIKRYRLYNPSNPETPGEGVEAPHAALLTR